MAKRLLLVSCLRSILLALLMAQSLPCFSMQVIYQSLDQVLPRTETAIVADVLHAETQRDSPYWRSLVLQVTPVSTLFGRKAAQRTLQCRYEEGIPHQRGERGISPLASGSGIEFDVVAGNRVILLLAQAPADADDCQVLRIEPLTREAVIRAAQAQP